MVDRYTKAVLTIIAAALVVLALKPSVQPAKADEEVTGLAIAGMAGDISDIKRTVSDMGSVNDDIAEDVSKIAGGTCTNSKICGF